MSSEHGAASEQVLKTKWIVAETRPQPPHRSRNDTDHAPAGFECALDLAEQRRKPRNLYVLEDVEENTTSIECSRTGNFTPS